MTQENKASSGNIGTAQLKAEDRALPLWQLRALRRGLLRSCCNCDYFDKETEGCGLASGTRPPAQVICLGCDKWMEEIPF